MSKTVENGVLKQLSPSSINKFDSTQAFGCERRWWFRYVKGLDEPQTGNQELGETLHALIEERLKTGKTPAVEHEAAGLYLAGQAMIESVAQRKIIGIEMPVAGFALDGVRVQGFVDLVTEDGIIDWKTSSDINRYGKTEMDLAKDTQMIIYALAMHSDLESVKLAHGQFQTRGRKATNFVEVKVTQKHLAEHRDKVIIPLVQKMKSAAAETDVTKLPRNEKSCFNCAFNTHCPSTEGASVMSFFAKMKPAGTPAASVLAGGLQNAVTQPVAPPDAPASQPELAAKPVEGFEPVPPPRKMKMIDVPSINSPSADLAHEAPKPTPPPDVQIRSDELPPLVTFIQKPKGKGGRPPGSKNKPKVVTPALDSMGDPMDLEATSEQSPKVVLKSVTVNKGYTINVGAFSGVRFDISATAEGADFEQTYEALYALVNERLESEAAKYQAEIDAKTKTTVPAASVVCK
jgi:CRISPR/Cas system-associated exonuclease Cas4 (RecB family)